MRVFLDEVAWLNTLTGAVHDELCRQIFKALGASGRAIRGAERRCVNVDYITRTDNNLRRRSYEFCSCTKVVLFGRNSLYFHSPTCAIVFVRVYIAPYCGNSLDVCGTLDNGVVCRSCLCYSTYQRTVTAVTTCVARQTFEIIQLVAPLAPLAPISKATMSSKHPLVGQSAPVVSLPNADGTTYELKPGQEGKPTAVFFYPKAGAFLLFSL
jgi:hypothetical protein